MIDSYNDLRFWDAYCKFFFAVRGENNSGIDPLAIDLYKHQRADKDKPETSLKVLCLGVGVGGFEYPLLSSLERVSSTPIEVTGIDLADRTLPVAESLFSDLQRVFQSASDFANFISDQWHADLMQSENTRFPKLDLDGRRSGNDRDTSPLSVDYPSLWHKRLAEKLLIPQDGFDVVTAAMCFHHMHWWRSTLCEALRMVRPGGVLLLSQADGDVSYLDWNQSEQWLIEERSGCSPGLVQRMMSAFWNDGAVHRSDGLQAHILKRAQAGAIRPWPQIDFLDRLPLKPLKLGPSNTYFARNVMKPIEIKAIMETCGLSPFRRAKEILGEGKYANHVASVCSKYDREPPSPTVNRIRWHAYKIPERSTLDKSGLFRKFLNTPPKRHSTATSKGIPAKLWEYELLEASAVSHDSFQTPAIDNTAFENFLKQLVLSGILSKDTPFGVMGQRLVRQEKFTSSTLCFTNPLGCTASIAELMLYMCLRQSHLKDFSNSNTLLKEILPRFPVPVVFSYVREQCKERKCPAVTVGLHRFRSFLEMRFSIQLPSDFSLRVKSSPAFREALNIVAESINSASANQTDNCASFVVPVAHIPENLSKAFEEGTKRIQKMFEGDLLIKQAHAELDRTRRLIPSLTDNSTSDFFAKHFSMEMVETLYWLCLIPDWNQVVIYPAAYTSSEGNGISADDSIILFYRSRLPDSHLRHEFRKASLMLDQLNMRRLATKGESVGLHDQVASFSHEVSKQTSILFSNRLRPLSAMFEVGKQPRTNDKKDACDWPEAIGTIQVPSEHEQRVASWLVCPNPELFRPLQDYLVLWAGAPGAIKHLAPGLRTANEFVEAAISVAKNSRVATILEGSEPPLSMKGVISSEAQVATMTETHLAKVRFDGLAEQIKLDWNDCKPGKAKERVLILCFRALVGAINNALQHTDAKQEIKIKVRFLQNEGLLVSIFNPIRHSDLEHFAPTTDGTKGVIKSCLQILDKDTIYPVCGRIDNDMDKNEHLEYGRLEDHWKTVFLLPNPADFREEKNIFWLKGEM